MSLVTNVMKNIIKVLVTDIKELSNLDKQRLIIFHDKYDIYDKWINRVALFQMFVLGFLGSMFLNPNMIFNMPVGLLMFQWWNSKV